MSAEERRNTSASESSEGERARKGAREQQAEDMERKIDRDLEDSFPASDPPGWTLGVERRERKNAGKPKRDSLGR